MIWSAYQRVKANKGGAGVDDESITAFEDKLKDNLYRIWNRMSSGTYFPPAVKSVEIPKKSGGKRVLGIPTVSDGIAQTVVKTELEGLLEPIFDADSYGYRPGRSAHQAIAITRERCWRYDWVVEFDIKSLFDNLNHELLLKALRYHCDCKWILLYVARWLIAPLQTENEIFVRNKGTPQGGVVSPVLANLFLHYAFDAWVRRKLPNIPFCRYADDGLLHCTSRRQAEYVLTKVEERFSECGFELNLEKTRIVYCKDKNRKEEFNQVSFDFLGYTFRPRRCVDKQGIVHPNFLPAVSRTAKKAMNQKIHSWRIQLKTEETIVDISKRYKAVMIGWHNYYSRFYTSALNTVWQRFNSHLVSWVRRKFKRFERHKGKAIKYVDSIARKHSHLFKHWQLGVYPITKVMGAG